MEAPIKTKTQFLIIFAGLFFFSPLVYAGKDCPRLFSKLPHETVKKLDKVAEKLRTEGNSPGFATTIFTADEIVWTKGLGTMRSVGGAPVDPKTTLFPVASVSKTFTAVAILQLVKQGKIHLDTPLSQLSEIRFVKRIKESSPDMLRALDHITVSHLLRHNSGMSRDLEGVNWFSSTAITDNQFPTFNDFDLSFSSLTFDYSPANLPASILYGNMNYNLLSQIVDAYGSSGSFSQYMQEHVFDPLGLSNSMYDIHDRDLQRLATTYGKTHILDGQTLQTEMPPVTKPGVYEGSVGVNISAEDLAIFGQNLLQLTSFEGRSQLNINRFDALTPLVLDTFEGFAFASGLILQSVKVEDSDEEVIFYGHTGTLYGSKAMLYVSPELNIGFVALANSRDAKTSSALKEYLKVLTEGGIISKERVVLSPEVQEWLEQTKEFISNFSQPKFFLPENIQEAVRFNQYETSDYIGDYYSNVDGPLSVDVNAESGRLQFLGAELLPYRGQPDMFHLNGMSWFGHAGGVIVFERDRDGQIIGMDAFNGEIVLERK